MKGNTVYRVQVLVGLMFLAAGIAKLAGADVMVRQFEVIGLGQWFRPVAGSLEIVGALSLFVPRTCAYGAALLSCIIIGSAGAMIGHVAAVGRAQPATEAPQITRAKFYQVELGTGAGRQWSAIRVPSDADPRA